MKNEKNLKNQKQPNEKQAGMDGSQNITLSLFPHSLHPHLYPFTCLSLLCLTCLPPVHLLPVCQHVQVCFLPYRGRQGKVSHPEWRSVRRDLPSGHISSRDTDRQRQEKGKKKKSQLPTCRYS